MNLDVVKTGLLLAVLVAGLLGGAIPLMRREGPGSGRWMSWGNAFAAGIFLGAGLIHMLPEANEAWEELGFHYPIAFLLAALAFVLLLLVEHVLLPDAAHRHSHAPSGEPFLGGEDLRSPLGAYAVLVALSLHSFVAGLALGAQPKIASALVIFVAIMAHKSTAGFALGVSMARGGLPQGRAWRLLILFALATPLGIAVGMALDRAFQGALQVAVEAAFLSLAAGTFVYVATLDILRDEFLESDGQWAQWLFVTLAIGLAAVLAVWI